MKHHKFFKRAATLAGVATMIYAIGAGSSVTQANTLGWLTYKPQGAGDPQSVATQWFG